MGKQSYRVCFCFRRWFHVGVSEPPEAIESLFNQYSENGIMTVDHLHRFLVEVQKERNPKKEDAQAIIDSMDDQLNLKHPHSSDQRKGLNLEAFFKYLLSEKNSPLCPSRGVHQDMKAPLSHYFIYTGHNSYLTGNQLNSKCSAGPIKDALKSGLRGIELDLWPSSKKKDGVEVCHGGTLTAPVDLTTCLETIKKYAFDASEYPVVITFEDHLPPNLQDKVAELVTGIFDKKDLLTADSDGSECLTEFPSPESLKGKIIISTKPPEDKAKDKENELPKSTSCHVNFPPFMKMFNHTWKRVCGRKAKHQEYPRPSASSSADEAEWGEEVPNLKGIIKTTNGSTNDKDYSDEEGSTNADGDSEKTQQNVVEAPKYRHLISMHAGKPKGGLKEWLKVEVDRVRRLSLSELQLERAVTKKYGQDIVRFTQSNVLRVYPKGLRIDSSNYNPLIAWSHGAQMVAFNMQGYGRPLWLMHGIQSMISQNRTEIQISGALWDLIQLVGERARRNTVLLMDRDNAEVFYSKVSDLEEVFYCLDKQLQYVISVEQPHGVQIQRTSELSNVCVTIVRTAMHYRNEHRMWYPPPEGLTPWSSQYVVRNGLWSIAAFILQLLNETPGLDMSAKSDVCAHLEALCEVLLEAYSGAITATVERGEEHKGLLNEYWNRRDSLLDSLYQQVRGSLGVRYQDLDEFVEDKDVEMLRKLSSSLLSIAKRHEGYKTMWKICCDLNDSELLRNLMHESMGPKGGFCQFVFKQLYEKRQFSKILRLGEEFQEELSVFLKYHCHLLWLHEVFLHQFSSASETLHVLALSENESSISSAEDGEAADHVIHEPTLADRKRLLNLAKIAVIAAGKDADSGAKVNRIEADLKILKLQEQIMKVLAADEVKQYVGGPLLRPEELVELCLKSENPELSLLAFDVFAWTSSSFRKSHRHLLEDCWKNAANQDDWGQLYQASIDEGWSDEETLQQLRDTLLFQASNRCYGPNAETIDEGFEEVLPLREGDSEDQILNDSSSSVEVILKQHKDFPFAGKLMLTAVMLGSVQDDVKVDDSPSPME